MNGNKNGGATKRGYRNFKLSPTTRAIRSALALSAAMLALSGTTTVAAAGFCGVSGLEEVSCNGTFTDDVSNYVGAGPYVDLTIIVGNYSATTVDPAAGVNGITDTFAGDQTVISYADINVTDAAGISMSGNYYSTAENYGNITAVAVGGDVEGIHVWSIDGSTVVNDGSVIAGSSAGTPYNATGVYAYTWDGSTSVTNGSDGTIIGSAGDGVGTGIYAYGFVDSSVTNDGFVSGGSFTNYAYGISSNAIVGDSTVDNNGTVEAYSIDGNAYGIYSFSLDGDSTVDNSGSVAAGGYDVTGITSNSDIGNASIINSGTVNVYADGYASGLDVTSNSGDASVTNSGSVYAYGYYGSYGASVVAYDGYASITTTADSELNAGSYYTATAAYAYGYDGASIDNAGSIYAGVSGYAWNPTYGFDAEGAHAYSYDGDATVTNTGYIGASAYGYTAGNDIHSTGAYAGSYNGNAAINNDGGTISAYSGSAGYYGMYAIGAQAYSYNGTASVTNSGSIGAEVYGYSNYGVQQAVGVLVQSYNGDATLNNSGTITSYAGYYGYYGINAVGAAVVAGGGDVDVVNSGTISAEAYGYGYFYGVDSTGLYASTYSGDTTVNNSGLISATSTNNTNYGHFYGPSATGIYAGAINGITTVDNSGTVTATAVNSYYGSNTGGSATGISVYAYENAYITNSGDVTATVEGASNALGTATGIDVTSKYAAYVDNSGTVTADGDYANSTGIDVYGKYGSTVDNSGTVSASSVYGNAIGINSYAYYNSSYVNNSGSVSADTDYGVAAGIISTATKYDGDTTVVNSGTVDAHSSYNVAIGINAYAGYGVIYNEINTGYVSVDNSGTVNATSDYYLAAGVIAQGYYDVTVINSGDITASGYLAAYGVIAQSVYGDVSVSNSGSIDASASGYGYYAMGVQAYSVFGDVSVDNSGTISAFGYTGYPGSPYNATYGPYVYGVKATGNYDVSVDNSGVIDVSAYSYSELQPKAWGVYAHTLFGDVDVDNSGTISVNSETFNIFYGPEATGVEAFSKYGDATASNSGVIDVTAQTDFFSYAGAPSAIGVSVTSVYGDVTVNNSGTITATAYGSGFGYLGLNGLGSATAVGVSALGVYDGYLAVNNSGDISANAVGGDYAYYAIADATGVSAVSYLANLNVGVYNEGAISATASIGYGSLYSSAIAHGVVAQNNNYTVQIYNGAGGSITATANIGDGGFDNQADAYGISTYSYFEDTTIVNFGSVSATATAGGILGYANATGIQALINPGGEGAINIYNDGDVSATAQNNAIGIQAQNYSFGPFYGVVQVANGGDGEITASASGPYNTSAIGVQMDGYYTGFYNEGAISASADGDYQSVALGTVQHSAYVGFHNYGVISAEASGDVAFAAGSAIYSNYSFYAYNGGDISASASGPSSYAAGFIGVSYFGSIELVNTGTISATADYVANGVYLASNYNTEIWNYGLIEASADVAYAINTGYGASEDYIYNAGTIDGGIYTGYADDFFYNAEDGVWNAGEFSYFGLGDDEILNYGVINMDDSVIDLGLYAVDGNYFYNYGTINVNGAYNFINMGDGPQFLVPSANPNAFYNGVGGVIDFQDGAPDDKLTIIGDFAGDGDINVDVSGLDEVSDVLYIDGSVVTGTAGVINVDLLDLPDTIEALIPIVYVTGNSVSGNFVLGEVNWDDVNTFVTLDFDIVADIDATNATPDVFALGIQVTGLSDPGTLAASIPGAVQSLMNSQVGTWRQRMGVIDNFNDGAISLWARIWTDKGGWAPEHNAGNFGNGGNFDWDQKNSGVEAGLDFAVTDEFSLGLLVAKSQADVDLADPGHGSADLDADTWGIYGTWISPTGFYLDASYRWMSFDVDLNSIAGPMQADGDAESFNLELGYAWTLSGGLKIEPQFQYTKTSVDSMDALVTTTNMQFVNDGGDSSRGRVGVAFRKSFGEADAGWLWTPYLTISAVREFDGENQYAINGTFFGETDLEGTSALLELGFTARHQNWSIYGGLNWQDGGAVDNWFGGQLGVRYTFGGPAPVAPPPPAPPAKTCADLDDDGDGINNCDDKCVTPSGEAVGADGCPLPPAPEPAPEPKPYRG